MKQPAEAETVVVPDWTKVVGERAEGNPGEMLRYLGIDCPVDVIQMLRQRMWRAISEFGDLSGRFGRARSSADPDALIAKAVERGFWTAIYSPIQQRLVRQALADEVAKRVA